MCASPSDSSSPAFAPTSASFSSCGPCHCFPSSPSSLSSDVTELGDGILPGDCNEKQQ